MGRKGRQRALDRFSWDAIADATLDLYRTLR
jgi:glycosyltransferase involved in cell wall biosynthesis